MLHYHVVNHLPDFGLPGNPAWKIACWTGQNPLPSGEIAT